MKTPHFTLVLTAFCVVFASSCTRNDSSSAAEPVRESNWKPVAAAPAPAAKPPAPAAKVAPAPPRPTAEPMKAVLDAGTVLAVRVHETMTSEKNAGGDTWTGVLTEPLVINGLVIADRGADVEGRVTNVTRAGRVKGVANLSIALTTLQTADGQRVRVATSPFTAVGKDETKKDVGKVAIASGVGAAIGAIVGGGKGAAIGAGSGAGAGTGVVLATRGGPAVIASESLVRFRVAEPVTIVEKIK